MKLKHLLLFLFVVGCEIVPNAQTKKPYNNLIITEAKMRRPEFNYVEFTNMGTETIDLSNFEFGAISPWDQTWNQVTNRNIRLWDPKMYPKNSPLIDKRYLAPGKSFIIAMASDFEPENWIKDPTHNRERVTKPEMYKLTNLILHMAETNSNSRDSITPKWNVLETWNGRDCWFLRHHYINETTGLKDSMIIDQVGGMFDNPDGYNYDKAYDVAGVLEATGRCVLIRKSSVKTGITEFSSTTANADAAKLQFSQTRGLDLGDSQWIPVPILGVANDYTFEPWRAVFWTLGNSVDAKLDATTLVSKTGKVTVDFDKSTITVPWGVRNDDSLMYQFVRKPGLAWGYDYAPTTEDSAYISARTGDKLTVYACGNEAAIKTFNIIVKDPTPSDNIVIPKNGFNYTRMFYTVFMGPYSGYRVSDGVKGMDTIRNIDFATRVDTLLKYLEKAPKANWKIVFKDGIDRPDLKNGDLLRVTSENGTVKDYFLKLEKFFPNSNADLASITWPDIPAFFKGDVARSYGWEGDTIPGFNNAKNEYVVKIPLEFQGIPALVYTKRQLDSKVAVKRAVTLEGTPAERTMTFTVTAENDTTINVYTVRFEKEKDPSNIQLWKGEPFISQLVFQDQWNNPWVEICNPGTEPLDLSHYMITAGYGGLDMLTWWNSKTDNYASSAYRKYVPGKKWQDAASWAVQPRILEPDLAVNAIVYPGDVFVMTQHGGGGAFNIWGKEVDVNFATGKNPWGFTMPWGNAIHEWSGGTYYFYKILNDSVVNGLKPATDIRDFELLDTFGNGAGTDWVIGGVAVQQTTGYTRKPTIYKGNPELKGSFGTNKDDCEWTKTDRPYWDALGVGWPLDIYNICTGIGSHLMNDVTMYRSTVSSKIYKVSPGFSKKETIKGLTTGTTVTGFYANILKANALQALKVKSVATGAELAATAAVSKGDTLIVLSADSTNTSKYILDVTANGLSSNALLTSTKYTINVTGTTGTIAGFPQRTLLKTVFAGVIVPAGATLTITDASDAYMSLTKLNYDTAYVNVIATDNVYFEVIAENGTTKVLYQLKPTSNPSDAYVTSDVYSVDQFASLIQFVPGGTSVHSLLSNVTPAPGAKIVVYDKAGFIRELGDVYRDDKLIVTSADGKSTKAYYFSMLNFRVNTYLAYVISDDYQIDQVKHTIAGPKSSTTLGEFYAKLYPSFGATMKVLNKNGVESKLADLSLDDKLLVTAADGKTTAVYNITVDITGMAPVAESIKIYPNPTSDGRVIIQGLAQGNRVQVLNAAGITLRDVIVDNSTEYVSLSAQPAGIYIFVISAGDQQINIQKIIKK